MTCEVPGIWPEDLSISSSLANRDAVHDHAALLLLPGRRAFLHVRRRTAEARLRPREPRLRLLDLPLLLLNLLLLDLRRCRTDAGAGLLPRLRRPLESGRRPGRRLIDHRGSLLNLRQWPLEARRWTFEARRRATRRRLIDHCGTLLELLL